MLVLFNAGVVVQRIVGRGMASRGPTSGGPVEQRIVEKITSALSPVHLAVVNESYMHSVPRGSETHFKVFVVSDKFEGQTPIKVRTGRQP
jgi:stress-induced morphogen